MKSSALQVLYRSLPLREVHPTVPVRLVSEPFITAMNCFHRALAARVKWILSINLYLRKRLVRMRVGKIKTNGHLPVCILSSAVSLSPLVFNRVERRPKGR